MFVPNSAAQHLRQPGRSTPVSRYSAVARSAARRPPGRVVDCSAELQRGGRAARAARELAGDLADAGRPALLLVEVVGPGGRPLAQRHHVRGVDALPLAAGGRVDRGVDRDAGEVVLDDRVLVAADGRPRRRPVEVAGAGEQRRVQPVAAPGDQAVEEVLLGGAVGDEVLVQVAVHLGGHHERDVRVGEVAERAFQEVRQRHVVRVDVGHHVVACSCSARQALWLPYLVRARNSPPGWLYSGRPLRLKWRTPSRAHRPHRRVVALVEQPDVDTPQCRSAQARSVPFTSSSGSLLGHDRGEQGDPQAGRRPHRDRVAGLAGVVGDRPGAQPRDQLQADHADDSDGGHQVLQRVEPRCGRFAGRSRKTTSPAAVATCTQPISWTPTCCPRVGAGRYRTVESVGCSGPATSVAVRPEPAALPPLSTGGAGARVSVLATRSLSGEGPLAAAFRRGSHPKGGHRSPDRGRSGPGAADTAG